MKANRFYSLMHLMKGVFMNFNKMQSFGMLLLKTAICIACTSDIPKEEPYPHDNRVVFGASPTKIQQSKKSNPIVHGIASTSKSGCINAILQVLSRIYKDEINASRNNLLRKIVFCVTSGNVNNLPVDIERFRSTLPEPYNNKAYEGNADKLLEAIHAKALLLGRITYLEHFTPDKSDHTTLDFIKKNDSTIVEGEKELLILNICPVNQDVGDFSKLIQIHQKKDVCYKRHKYFDKYGIQHEKQIKGIKEIVFKELPNKLCVSLARDKDYMDNYNLGGTETIKIIAQYDFSSPKIEIPFHLEAFLVPVSSNNQTESRHFVAFIQLDGHWYGINDDKVIGVSKQEAIVASAKGVLFFYRK
ncbi:hypothetical protein [Cardinium endosymbiont of Culicoides punctatus]|uniref:hypothetical protein n=1 Tax=Cardinium endosymbiont of Culicoides punctatus TaxID=2304601 RepID=UPI0010584504|nr:hypothetical protein [Cardinium endosymbiont of Culicoides punctatus]TDG94795.1 hypothetical protein CCPUN_07200 [Cardinium endosymbiont of Culicoides punctatus]